MQFFKINLWTDNCINDFPETINHRFGGDLGNVEFKFLWRSHWDLNSDIGIFRLLTVYQTAALPVRLMRPFVDDASWMNFRKRKQTISFVRSERACERQRGCGQAGSACGDGCGSRTRHSEIESLLSWPLDESAASPLRFGWRLLSCLWWYQTYPPVLSDCLLWGQHPRASIWRWPAVCWNRIWTVHRIFWSL